MDVDRASGASRCYYASRMVREDSVSPCDAIRCYTCELWMNMISGSLRIVDFFKTSILWVASESFLYRY